MAFNSRYKPNQRALAATAVGIVAAGTGLTGALVVDNAKVAEGTALAAELTVAISTGSLTLAPKFQGSADNTNWVDLHMVNNAANVALSATGTTVVCLPCKVPFRYVRLVVLTAGATGASADTYAVKYHWIENAFL